MKIDWQDFIQRGYHTLKSPTNTANFLRWRWKVFQRVTQRTYHQQQMLNMLEITQQIFKQHNILYFAEAGTLLGCLRHHGFIAWDIDLDIGIRMQDVDKLLDCDDTLRTHDLRLIVSHDYNHYTLDDERVPTLIRQHTNPEWCANNLTIESHGIVFRIIPAKDFAKPQRIYDHDGLKIHSYESERHIDIYIYYKPDNRQVWVPINHTETGLGKDFYLSAIEPIMPCRFEDTILPIPSASIHYLHLLYGNDCLTHDDKGQDVYP